MLVVRKPSARGVVVDQSDSNHPNSVMCHIHQSFISASVVRVRQCRGLSTFICLLMHTWFHYGILS